MQFANGVCATFTVTAFTQECCRTMRAMGSLGELEIDMLRNRVMLRRFGQPEQIIELDKLTDRFAGHGGGDDRMMDALAALFQREDPASLTSVDVSIDSHIMRLLPSVHGWRRRLHRPASVCPPHLIFPRRYSPCHVFVTCPAAPIAPPAPTKKCTAPLPAGLRRKASSF